MSSLKYVAWSPGLTSPSPRAATRRLAALALRRASAVLARMARRLAQADTPRQRLPAQLEFYAEAGAPEGALYLDGELVGYLRGVTRL